MEKEPKYVPSSEEGKKAEEMMSDKEKKISEEREKNIRKRETERCATENKFEPYLKSRDKSLSNLTDVVKNKLLDELSLDATEVGYGWHEAKGLDIKDNIAAYIKYFNMGGMFEIRSKNIDLKIISEDSIIEKRIADEENERKFEKYDKYTTVDIINIDKKKSKVTVKLTGENVPKTVLSLSYQIEEEK